MFKLLHSFTFCLSLFFVAGHYIYPQTNSSYEPKKIITIDGSEESNNPNAAIISVNTIDYLSPVYGNFFTFNIHNITNIQTGYDFQSNGCSQEVWYDINNGLIHSIFTHSNEAVTPWSDRTTKYFFSGDQGVSWIELGNVPTDGARSGFPAISGLSTGAAVLANHSAEGGTPTRAKIFIDNSIGEFNLTTYDPGSVATGNPIWPRVTVDLNDNVHLISSINATTGTFYDRLVGGVFDGYTEYDGDVAGAYSLAVSYGGKIGHAYLGDDISNEGDVFYRESFNNGISWSIPVKIFDATPEISDTSYGAIRGISCNFYGEEAAVVWQDALQGFSSGTFFPDAPNHIWFWSPNVNGGNAIILADSNNVPFAPSLGTNDVLLPLSRPVVGRSEVRNYLFVAFYAATSDVFPSADPTTYFAGYFTFSSDGGQSWLTPEKFTPESPLRDWRYISIAPVNPVVGSFSTVHMVLQGDSIPGSTVNAAGMPVGVTAQYYHVSTSIFVIPVELTSFIAQLVDNNINLNWSTATETNNLGFEVHRKILLDDNEGEWKTLGFKPGAGTTAETQEYSFSDDINNILASSFIYRLKQVDYDGSYEYSEEVVVENTTLIPNEFNLSQNYPNPFNPSTLIKYSVPENGFIKLSVYNLIGEEVSVLVNEIVDAGFYEVTFNATNLPSGTYFYRLQAGNTVQVKKMVLIK